MKDSPAVAHMTNNAQYNPRIHGRLFLVMLSSISVGVSVHNLNAAFLGEVENNSVAVWSSNFCFADLMSLLSFLNLWNCDALFSNDVFAAHSDNFQRLVNTHLGGLRDNKSLWLNVVLEFWGIVASLLSNLLAVNLMTIPVLLVAWVTDSDHLCDTRSGVDHRDGFSLSFDILRSVGVDTDFIGDGLDRLRADCAGDRVALFFVNNALHSHSNILTNGGKCGCASLGILLDLGNSAVVFWVLVFGGSIAGG